MTYALVTFSTPDLAPAAGVLNNEKIYPLARTMLELLAAWAELEPTLATHNVAEPFELAEVQLHAPVLFPGAVFGSGANYTDHLVEMANVMNTPVYDPKAAGQSPWHFVKVPRTSVVGPDAAIRIPTYAKRVDWEIELAVIIGRRAHEVSVADALDYVAGYTIANDLSARDHVKRQNVPIDSPFAYDWVSQKCFEGSCPLGPSLVPARFVPDPQNLPLKLWLNGELVQDSSTSQMIFSVAEQIAYLSSRAPLHPGDVILTGTPAGVGMARNRFLSPGDRMKLEIPGLGVLENSIA